MCFKAYTLADGGVLVVWHYAYSFCMSAIVYHPLDLIDFGMVFDALNVFV